MNSLETKNVFKYQREEGISSFEDQIIVEAPLEIFIYSTIDKVQAKSPFATTMRTPGKDKELCAGLLYSLGIIDNSTNIIGFRYKIMNAEKTEVLITINKSVEKESLGAYINSSCGICNTQSLEDVTMHSPYPIQDQNLKIKKEDILGCFLCIQTEQDLFSQTGGNHKVCLTDSNGKKIYYAEDVGRHNAMDKVVGWAILHDYLPLSKHIVLLSGRCSFEMCQKAWLAGIPMIASLGAPSTLAIELAENVGITLIGFLKEDGFNVYNGVKRII